MQAKDIPAETILGIVREYNEGRAADRVIKWGDENVLITGKRWCLFRDIEERIPDVPPKVILAKCRNLIKRGMLGGCGCGCRGDFEVKP